MKTSLLLGGALAALSLVACSQTESVDRRAELEELLGAGQPDEVLARVAVYREAGERGPSLDFGEGLALLAQNNDKKAAKLLASAVRGDSLLAAPIAEAYHAAAVADHGERWYNRAERRMREAFRHNPDLDLTPVADPVADLLYRHERDYAQAYQIYRKLIHKRGPAQQKQREWMFRYGHCLEKMGFVEDALAQYRAYEERWPDDTGFMRMVMYQKIRLLLEKSERLMEDGDLDTALTTLDELFHSDWHVELQQEGRYLAGQIEERRQDPAAALDWYNQILANQQFGGEVVELAWNRVEELRAQGVH